MSVGESLARARQDRGLTVEEISSATRIRSGLIRGIEADNFDPCGGDVYARGHIRSIARVIGIDPEPLIADYDREHGGPPAGPLPVQQVDPDVAARTERRKPNWTAAMVVALLVICGLAAAQLVGGNKSSPKQTKLAVGSTTPSPTPKPHASTPPPGSTARLPPNEVTLLLRIVSDRSWLEVQRANQFGPVLFMGILSTGAQKVFTDSQPLYVVIGNAGAVDLVVNGHELGPAGGVGQVVRRTFTVGASGTAA